MTSQPMAEPSQPISSFDPEVFWALHKQKIVLGAALAVLVLLCSSIYFGLQIIQTQNAEKAYSAAQSFEAWQAVIRQYPNSIAAGNAYLRIGAKLREDGKYPESDTNYETFIRQFPKHPLVVNGYVGLAANAESEKNPDKALEYWRQVATLFGNSFQAPMALFHEARITAAKGQLKEAQALYESIVQRFPESTAAGIASHEAGSLADRVAALPKPQPATKPAGSASTTPTSSASGTPGSAASATPPESTSPTGAGSPKPQP
ncbi:MAG TPA: tetratricopeptide repeat protein [Chthoniobacterales bacterium]